MKAVRGQWPASSHDACAILVAMDAGLAVWTAISGRQLTSQANADTTHMVNDPDNPRRE
ncbi:MAG: hypothetical protein H7238_04245 [Polaromonas sp.]|nr:hypothetical protein [Polaromonas sp.]